ncbi:insulinase family protein [Candidatus Falkowbacteria bacterium]|nr:insulinase family protein [Candidatus Falkowbacteria bacterium]
MFKKAILDNGLRVVAIPMAGTKTVTVLVLVGTGSRCETKDINGISHFLEHMFFKGTKKRPTPADIVEELDSVGGEYNAFTSKEYTGYFAKVNYKQFDLALDWIADIFLNSQLEEKEIEKEKGVILEEINMYLDTPIYYIGHLWESLLYGDQPAGWHVLGGKENILNIGREQIANYLKSQYAGSNTLVCVAGNFNENETMEKIKKYFGKLKSGSPRPSARVLENQGQPEILTHFKKTDQTHFCLGARGYGVFHADRYVFSVLGIILGGFMSSRLFQEVREKRGLAYYIKTSTEISTDVGYLVTQAGVANSKIEEAVETILAEYRFIREKGVSEKELLRAKEHVKGSLLLNLETSDEQASFFAIQEILKKEILTPEQVFAKIDMVSVDDVRRVADDIFKPEKLNLALIGPFKNRGRFEKLLRIL